VAGVWIAVMRQPESLERLRTRAQRASREGHWQIALNAWRTLNSRPEADAYSHLAEARACLALGRARQAENALERCSGLDPANPEPWLIRLEIARIENRLLDANLLGQRAQAAVRPDARREILRGLTLALLADAPDEMARATLSRWIEADPEDLDARAALERRMSENPRAGDPAVAVRLPKLEELVRANPKHFGLLEAYILAIAEAGEPVRGKKALELWPKPMRDARYDRLRGRWELEYERDPRAAARSLARALEALPNDTRTRYRLARALQASGQVEKARQVGSEVARLNEILEPVRLGQRLDAALANLDDPTARQSLAELCESVGLTSLSQAWRRDLESRAAGPGPSFPSQKTVRGTGDEQHAMPR
jgi:tetratricopeptide (TPR) repeat protein